jgi:hypothetical protein
MVKRISFIAILSVFALFSFSFGYWVSLDGSAERSPEINVVYSNAAETVLEFRIYGFNVEEVSDNDTLYHRISFPEMDGTTNEIGKPELPTIAAIVGIPDNAEVNFEILEIEAKDTTGFFVFPFQKPTSSIDTLDTFYIDTVFYNRSDFFPDSMGELSGTAVMRTIHFISCIICPLEFNPAFQKIRTNTYIRIRLTNFGGILQVKHITAGYGEILENFLVNYGYMNIEADLPDRRETGTEYLFITHENHQNTIEDLVNWYKMLGYQTRVKSYGYTPAPPEVKDEISDEYFSHTPPCLENVLLVGSKNEIPPYESGSNYPMSDSWYSFLEGGPEDYYPDIGIGRLSAGIEHFAERILRFEKNPNLAGGWLDEIQLIAHWQNTHEPGSTYYNPIFKEACEEVIKDYQNWQEDDFNLIWGENLYNANNIVRNSISSGKQIVCYYGHGLEDRWNLWAHWGSAYSSWTASNIDYINHSNRPPILLSNCCLNNHLCWNCINEYWTSREEWERSGVSAALGGAHNLYYPTMTTYMKEWFNQLGNNYLELTLGYAHMVAAAKLIDIHNNWYAEQCSRVLLLLGDPAMEPWVQIPVKFTAKNDFDGSTGGELFIGPVQVDSPWEVYVQQKGRRRYFYVRTISPQIHNGETYYFHHWNDGHENSHYILPNTGQDETRIAYLSTDRYPEWEYLQPQSQWAEPKKYHAAASACGKICALFGHSQYATHTNTCHIYDPINDEWINTSRDPKRRYAAGVSLNKKIYILGGQLSSGSILKRVDIYDPYTGNWAQGANMLGNKEKHTACVYQNKIYTMGGLDFLSNPDKRLYVFDLSSGWQEKEPMNVPRYNLASAAACGKIYVIGGIDDSGKNDKNCIEAYNPYEDTWEQDQNHGGIIKPMPFELSLHSCTSVNGKIYVIGGTSKEIIVYGTPRPWTSYRAIVLEYDPIRNEWEWKTSIESERGGLAVTSMPSFKNPVSPGGAWPAVCENTIYVIGGEAKIPFTPNIEIANIPIEASPWAFGHHNSQILDTDSSGCIHFVYVADNGWIYYTSSKDGISYENPSEISQGENPNLAIDSEDNIHLLWTKNSHLCYKKIDGNTGLLSEDVIVWSPTHEYPKFGGPAMAVSHESLFVAWEAKEPFPPLKGIVLLFGSAALDNVGSTFSYKKIDQGYPYIKLCPCTGPPHTEPDTILECPSIDVDNQGNPYIVWDKAHPYSDIFFYKKENGIWISTIISDTSVCTQETDPNIRIENGTINVVWSENYDPCYSNDIYYKKGYVKGGWELEKKVCTTTEEFSATPVWSNGYVLWQEEGDIKRNKYDYCYFEFENAVGENITDISGINPDMEFYAPRVVSIGKRVSEFFLMEDTTETHICLNVEEMEAAPPLYAINLGHSDPSPYTIERDGYIEYGDNFFEIVDFDSTKLIYCFDGIAEHPQNHLELVLYHEGDSKRKLRVRIDDSWTRNVWVSPGEPIVIDDMIPVAFLKDGEIDITVEPVSPTSNELAVCSAIWIRDLSKKKGGSGPQFAEGKENAVIVYSLKNCYPDPFNKSTIINYSIQKAGNVSLRIFDISGRIVRTLVNEYQNPGVYQVKWNGKGNNNQRVASGIYFYRLESGKYISSKKVVYVK